MEKKNNKGFTLMEMLLVVAIIAILAAVTIPSFSTVLAAQKEKNCEANRSALATAVTLAVVGGKDSVRDNADGTIWVAPALLAQYACPGGGTYTVLWNAETLCATVQCSKHGGEGIKIVQTTAEATAAVNAIADVIKGQTAASVTGVDSTAASKPGSAAYAMMQTEAGQTLKNQAIALNAVSWSYDGSNQMFYWSTLNVETLSAGDKVPVMRYNYKTGTYTVWIATVKVKTNTWKDPETGNNVTYTYNVFNSFAGYKPSTVDTDKPHQTYEQMVIHYQDALKEKGLA